MSTSSQHNATSSLPQKAVEGQALPSEEEHHARIDAEFEAEGHRLKRAKFIKRLTTFLVLGGVIGGSYFWYQSSPENQAKLQSIVTEAKAVKDAVKEGTSVTGIMESYDVALEEIDAHGGTVDSAAAALRGEGTLDLEAPKIPSLSGEKDEQENETELAQTETEAPPAPRVTSRRASAPTAAAPVTNETPTRRGF